MLALRRIAVVGSGISGLSVAHALAPSSQLTLFEAGEHFGGHSHTVDVRLNGVRHGVDTGFLVFNHRTYPRLVGLFDALGVPTAASEMSFSVQVPQQGIEWSGCDLNTVFAQRSNLLRPRFLGMLAQILRFNRLARGLAEAGDDASLTEPIARLPRPPRLRRRPSATGTCCRCWAASGHARPTRCCAFRWPR